MRNQHGSLIPFNAGARPGGMMPPPVPSAVAPRPEDLMPMYPPEYWPDDWLQLCGGGRPFWYQTRDYPFLVPTLQTRTTLVQTSPSFAHFVFAAVAVMRAVNGQNAGINDFRYSVDVKRRNMNLQDEVDVGFVPIQSVFGTGEYPHWYAEPCLWPGDSTFLFETRNNAPVDLLIEMQFLVARQPTKRR